jgi:predicted Zn-dependent protease
VQVGGTFQSKPYQGVNVPSIASQSLAANWVVPNALVAPSLGRNLAGGAANVTVNLVEPGTLYGDRINQLDVRVGRRFSFGQRAITVGLDGFNILNSSAVLTYNQTYGLSWLTPQAILVARFAKVSAQFDF